MNKQTESKNVTRNQGDKKGYDVIEKDLLDLQNFKDVVDPDFYDKRMGFESDEWGGPQLPLKTQSEFEGWARRTLQPFEDKTKVGNLELCRAYAYVKYQAYKCKEIFDDYRRTKTWRKKETPKKDASLEKVWNTLDILVGSKTRQTVNRMVAVGNDARVFMNKEKMPASWGTLYELTRLDDIQFKVALDDGRINPSMTRSEALAIRYPYGKGKSFRNKNELPKEVKKGLANSKQPKKPEYKKWVKVGTIYAGVEEIDKVYELLSEIRKKSIVLDKTYFHDEYGPNKAFGDRVKEVESQTRDSITKRFEELNVSSLFDVKGDLVVPKMGNKINLDERGDYSHSFEESVMEEFRKNEKFYALEKQYFRGGVFHFRDLSRREDFIPIMKELFENHEKGKSFFDQFDDMDELIDHVNKVLADAEAKKSFSVNVVPITKKKGKKPQASNQEVETTSKTVA